jgi:predicted MPP superfamily phosphohydrolase
MISRRLFLRWLAALAAAGVGTPAYGAIEPLMRPRIARYELRMNRWPRDLELTIAALADIHACAPWMTADRISAIVEQTNALGADVIVLLGDYVASHRYVTGRVPASEWSNALSGLKAQLGVHAILGNHDWWDDKSVQRAGHGSPVSKRALETAGIPVYDNDVVRLTKGNSAFWLAGLGDQLAYMPSRRLHARSRIGVDNLAGTLAKVSDDAPVILLAHEPDIVERVPERVALMLSGHTHGGQIRLFGWSPRQISKYVYGHVRENCDLIISGGLGCSLVPIRIGMPPEIVLVKLSSADRDMSEADVVLMDAARA